MYNHFQKEPPPQLGGGGHIIQCYLNRVAAITTNLIMKTACLGRSQPLAFGGAQIKLSWLPWASVLNLSFAETLF